MPAYVLKCEGGGRVGSFLIHEGEPPEARKKQPFQRQSHLPLNHQLGHRVDRAARPSRPPKRHCPPSNRTGTDTLTAASRQSSPFSLINTPLSGLTPDAVIGS